ncbi:MAG TPA: hypothetical protein VN426_16340 [Syntrophomonadaceae bacterium]|nr:hypothetical protein [Syntrophomonadaceae bacterium]
MKIAQWIKIMILLLVILAAAAGCAPSPGPGNSGTADESAPAFTLPDINGGQVAFPADFKNHKVALVFFSVT